MGADEGIFLDVPGELWGRTDRLYVSVCLGDECREFSGALHPDEVTELHGVTPMASDNQVLVAWNVPRDWNGDQASLLVEAFTADDRLMLRHQDSFRFDRVYPNGEDCDKFPSLQYHTAIETGDLLPAVKGGS